VIRLLKVLVIAFAYKEHNCSKSDQMFFCAVIHLYCEQCQYSSLQLLYKLLHDEYRSRTGHSYFKESNIKILLTSSVIIRITDIFQIL
jgi:hypothetical protein